jgi:hypothetical protein
MLSQKALRDQLEQTNTTLKHLVNSKVSLSDTTGLQEDIKTMGNDISKAVQLEAESNTKGLRAIGDDIVSAIKKSKGDAEMSSPDNKKRKTPWNLRQETAPPRNSGDLGDLGDAEVPMEETPPAPSSEEDPNRRRNSRRP